MRIRVTTRADLFEERKRQHIERGYRIEDEQPTAVNGLCSFVAVEESGERDTLAACVAEALKRNNGFREDW
ncbi:MAG: hypothetical protein JOZ80_07225 [Acidobacteriaceae bacterium]|nr:hypothetical protein [Acidobacteriaceae bacterium]